MSEDVMDNPEMAVRKTAAGIPSLLAVYLFGSIAAGRRGPLSDIDVAVLAGPTGSRECLGQFADALCRALRTERLDVVSLNEAPPPLAYRVIRDGRLILCRDERARELFESDTIMRYLDFKPVREAAFRTSRANILGVA
jgi:predicted nucleotidyltransferase